MSDLAQRVKALLAPEDGLSPGYNLGILAALKEIEVPQSPTPAEGRDWQPMSTARRDRKNVLLRLTDGLVITANAKLGTRPSYWPQGRDWPTEAIAWMNIPEFHGFSEVTNADA